MTMNLKIGYVIDSASGLSKDEAHAKGFYFLPLVININGKDYLDGDDLKAKQYYQKISLEDNVRTSFTPPKLIKNVLTKAAKENDYVIVYPMSKHLSSQLDNIQLVAKTMQNVYVIESMAIATIIEKEITMIQKFATKSKNINEIMAFANQNTNNWNAILVPRTLQWLVKGGRINRSVAKMASLLKIVPIIRFKDGKLEKEGKGRIYRKTCIKSFKKIAKETQAKTIYILIGNGTLEKELASNLKKTQKNLVIHQIPPVIASHCGPNSFIALAKMK